MAGGSSLRASIPISPIPSRACPFEAGSPHYNHAMIESPRAPQVKSSPAPALSIAPTRAAWRSGWRMRARDQGGRRPPQSGHPGVHLRQGAADAGAPVRFRPAALPGAAHRSEGGGALRADLVGRRARPRGGWPRRPLEGIDPALLRRLQRPADQDTTDARLFHRLGASRLARTVCAAPSGRAATGLYGKMAGVAFQDFPHARLIVLWGVNPSASGIHLVPFVLEAQKAARAWW